MTVKKNYVTRCFTCEDEDKDKDSKQQRQACWWTKTESQAVLIKGVHIEHHMLHEVVVRSLEI